jgi:hypothetical protein
MSQQPAPRTRRPPQFLRRLPAVVLALIFQFVGSTLVGYGMGQIVRSTVLAPHAAPTPHYVVESLGCATCPSGVRFRAASVEAHQGSTLFIVDGTWPAALSSFPADIRLVANDIELILHPSPAGMQILKGTKGAGPIDPSGIGVGVQGDQLYVNIAGTMTTPLRFEFGLWKDGTYLGRLPDRGTLIWDGHAAPRPAQ